MSDYTPHCPRWFQNISWTGWICANLRWRLCRCIFVAQGTFFRILVMHWKIGLLKSMEYKIETDKTFYQSKNLNPLLPLLRSCIWVCSGAQKYSWHILSFTHPSPCWHFFDSIHWQIQNNFDPFLPSRTRKSWRFMIEKKNFLRRFCHTKMQAWLW